MNEKNFSTFAEEIRRFDWLRSRFMAKIYVTTPNVSLHSPEAGEPVFYAGR
jgi:hypothetical protein